MRNPNYRVPNLALPNSAVARLNDRRSLLKEFDRLNREVRAIVELPEVQRRLAELGGVPSPSTPEEMRERIEREIAKWKRVVELKKIERQ